MAGNVSFTVNQNQLRDFDRRLATVGRVFNPSLTGRILRQALKPTLAAVKSSAPSGPRAAFQSATRVRGSRKGTTRPGYENRRGGFTRRDARTLIVKGKNTETVRGLVGISQKGDRAGYRTHFITRTNLKRRVANDFLGRAERQTEGQVKADFLSQAEAIVQKTIDRG